MLRQGRGQLICCIVMVLSLFLVHTQAVSNHESNVQNTITEEERRGADHVSNHIANDVNAAKKNAKLLLDDNSDKKRGIHAIHSPSASYKTTQYFVPSAFDSHIGTSGHGGGGHSGGGGYIGSTSGYDYVGGGGHSNHGSTAPSSGGGLGLGHHGHSHHHHNGPSGYASSATGFGGYGLSHGGFNHGGSGLHIGGHLGGQHGQFGGNAVGHSGSGGLHNALALKGLLIPLAGIALLGAAAALSTNPVLLQLGVVNGRRRRRRAIIAPRHYAANPHVQPVSNY